MLLVDDEPGILRSTELLLHELGFETVSTTRPAEILSTLRRERPDVLLQDVRMPELDIDSLLVRIREDPVVGLTPVLLFSASMDLDEVQDRVGAQGYLEKPFKPDEVVRAIQRVVRR
ncbi:MAG TPA: response regulator [Candidatus Thermoplasmatota archaeon]|nr:response regulator [Candidatus Thermoplasmatota archaeon]